MTFTVKILANNQIRIKHSVGRRPGVPAKIDEFSTLRYSDNGKIVPLRPDPDAVGVGAGASDSAAPLDYISEYRSVAESRSLTTLQKINASEGVEKTELFPGHPNWGKRQKPKKFRSFARDSVSEACCVLDRLYNRDDLRFITLTLPGSRFECLDLLSRYSGFLINRLRQVLRRSGIPHHDVFVWELQKRGALHIHWVIGASDSRFKFLSPVEVLATRLKDKWFDLLLEIGDKENIDMFARKGFGGSHKDNPTAWQWKIEKIRKSVQQYLSKYTSKGFNQNSGQTKSYSKIQARFSPSRWWGQSQNLLKEVRKYRTELKFETLSTEECNLMTNRLFELIPLDTISYYYYKEWSLDDIGISGVTMGAFIDFDKFDTVCSIIAPFVWEWYGEVECGRRHESSALMASRRAELWADVRQNTAKFEALVRSSSRPILEMYGGAVSA